MQSVDIIGWFSGLHGSLPLSSATSEQCLPPASGQLSSVGGTAEGQGTRTSPRTPTEASGSGKDHTLSSRSNCPPVCSVPFAPLLSLSFHICRLGLRVVSQSRANKAISVAASLKAMAKTRQNNLRLCLKHQ